MIKIPFNTASSKNSKRWTGRMLISSKLVLDYEKNTYLIWQNKKEEFLELIKGKEKPYRIELYFIRDSKRHFDYINVSQIVFDLMQKHEWIENDDMENILPSFSGYHVDKRECGVIIKVL